LIILFGQVKKYSGKFCSPSQAVLFPRLCIVVSVSNMRVDLYKTLKGSKKRLDQPGFCWKELENNVLWRHQDDVVIQRRNDNLLKFSNIIDNGLLTMPVAC